MICGLLFAVSSAVSSALFAEGSHADIDLDHQTRTAARTIGLLLAVGSLGLLVAGRPLLGLFGSAYTSEGYPLLILLLLARLRHYQHWYSMSNHKFDVCIVEWYSMSFHHQG